VLENLKKETERLGKAAWRPMLAYVARLHERATHPPRDHFAYPWEDIGPGYAAAPAFGHWDIVHATLDVAASEPEHAKNQILNNLALQQPDGFVPGVIYMGYDPPRWNAQCGHPPLWPVAATRCVELTDDGALLAVVHEALLRQLSWFEANRRTEDGAFYYYDLVEHRWESGVDEGVRFDLEAETPSACIDATAHLYCAYEHAAQWAQSMGREDEELTARADQLRRTIQTQMFDEETGLFHDARSVGNREFRPLAYEGMWPVVVGAAEQGQAERVIDGSLLNPERFLCRHPICTVAQKDPRFELRLWRGPAWNSMTYWAATGCVRYGRADAARLLLERTLDGAAEQFVRTGTIWEFYHPFGGEPETLERKRSLYANQPCRDYLGHNPLIAMARLWSELEGA